MKAIEASKDIAKQKKGRCRFSSYQPSTHNLNVFPLDIEIPAELYGTVSAFRQFRHRLSFTIRRPDHLVQDLCARGVIDESIVVSACVLVIDCFGMLS